MAEPSIINPELFSHSQLIPEIKLKHSIPFLCDFTFNAQDREKAVDFIGCSNQTQVTENYWWKKSSGLISFRCRKPTVSMMMNHNTRISLFPVDVTNDDDAVTIFHLDESTNLSVFGGSGRYGASLIPGTMKDPHHPVRKAADTQPGNGNETDQSANNSNGISSEGSNDPYDSLKDGGGNDSGFGSGSDGGNGSGNGNGNADNNDGGNGNGDGADNDSVIQIHRIAIHLDDWFVLCLPIMQVPIHALKYKSWKHFARAICVRFWVQMDPDNHKDQAPVTAATVPDRWYPGSLTPFGRLEGECFYHFKSDHLWDAVKLLIKDVCVIFN